MKKLSLLLIIIIAIGNINIFAQSDTVCVGSIGNIYDVIPSAGSTFTWSLKNNLGTISPIPGRSDSILVTYGSIAGIDTLRSVEIGPSGCLGDTMKLAIYILPNITATLSGTDSICVNDYSTNKLRVVFTGTSPWSITYTDGITPVSVSGITTNPYLINSPVYFTIGIRTFSLISANATGSCPATITGSGSVSVFTKPVSSGISHY